MAETIGSLVDKITIVDLKIYHMKEQVDRTDISGSHRKACQLKVAILIEQRNDLTHELNGLAQDIFAGRKELKVYRQFKMYNDPVFRFPTKKT